MKKEFYLPTVSHIEEYYSFINIWDNIELDSLLIITGESVDLGHPNVFLRHCTFQLNPKLF